MSNEVKENSLKTLRVYLFEEIIKIRKGEAVEKESIALAKLSSQIINSYAVEVQALKVVNELKGENNKYAKTLGVLNNE